MVSKATGNIIIDVNVAEYFKKSVASAVVNQSMDTTEDTLHYVVNLLTRFANSSVFFEEKCDGPRVTPLAKMYADAVASRSRSERRQAMRRLGDVALFIAGLFSESLRNRMVDVDYYIGMGGAAYGYVSESFQGHYREDIYGEVFSELAEKFTAFVDILAEVGEQSVLKSNSDLLRTYELWLKTGSKRAEKRLREFGISPSEFACSASRH